MARLVYHLAMMNFMLSYKANKKLATFNLSDEKEKGKESMNSSLIF